MVRTARAHAADVVFAVASLNREICASWGRSEEALLRAALENVRRCRVTRVAMPTRNTLFCVPLEERAPEATAARVAEMTLFVDGIFSEFLAETRGEAMFSPHLYWWKDGAIEQIPARVTELGPMIAPPEGLSRVLRLPSPSVGN